METTKELSSVESELNAANSLLDDTISTLGLKNDAALSRKLEVAPPVISKIRHGRLAIGDSMLIRLHEVTGWSTTTMKMHLGRKVLEPHDPTAQKLAA